MWLLSSLLLSLLFVVVVVGGGGVGVGVVVVVVAAVVVVVGPDVFWVPFFISPSGYLITLLDFLEVREGEADNVLNVNSSYVLLPYSSEQKTNGLVSCRSLQTLQAHSLTFQAPLQSPLQLSPLQSPPYVLQPVLPTAVACA